MCAWGSARVRCHTRALCLQLSFRAHDSLLLRLRSLASCTLALPPAKPYSLALSLIVFLPLFSVTQWHENPSMCAIQCSAMLVFAHAARRHECMDMPRRESALATVTSLWYRQWNAAPLSLKPAGERAHRVYAARRLSASNFGSNVCVRRARWPWRRNARAAACIFMDVVVASVACRVCCLLVCVCVCLFGRQSAASPAWPVQL